jgi:hypothetical protein
MTGFQLSDLRNSSVWGLYRLKDRVEMNPVYQREGDIWDLDKRQLLIDTIVNQFDVPKIYLHKFPQPLERDGKSYEYAVIDGKQRLTAIWAFIDGNFPLAEDFTYLKDEESGEKVVAANLTYADLARKYPEVKTDFDSYALDVVCIETDDLELIEDLFSRLNEAVPLSAPEKRNALPGPLPAAVRTLARHAFFTRNLPFTNRRYRHYDLAAKMLLIVSQDEVSDTKKVYLDLFFREGRYLSEPMVDQYSSKISEILDAMNAVFVESDGLLRQIGMTVLYFHLFRRARSKGLVHILHREAFIKFEEERRNNRTIAETDIARADYRLLEFDRYIQSPNDAYAMRIRLAVVDERAFGGSLGFPPLVGAE